MASILNPKLVIGLGLDKLGLDKGLKGASKDLQSLDKTAQSTVSTFGRLKTALGSVFSSAAHFGGVFLLYNVFRDLSGALGGLISASIDFDEQMHNVNSVAQLGAKSYKALTDQVLALAEDPRIIDMPAKLASGLYTIISSGYKAADAMKILKAAAMGATAGMTTTAVASDVLVSTLGAFGRTADESTKTMDELFQIVFISKYTFEQLAQSLATVTPSAAALGLSIEDVGAAMATMGRQGTDAATATVQLNAVLTGLLKPTDAMTELLTSLGYSSGEAAIKALGFTGVLKLMAQATGGSAEKAAELFGDVRALRGILQLLKGDGSLYTENLEMMSHAQDGAGATAKALAQQMKAARYQVRLLHKNIVLFFTEGIGGKFTAAMAKALMVVNHFFDSFFKARRRGVQFLSALFVGLRSTILKALGRDMYAKVRPFLVFLEKVLKTLLFLIAEVTKIWWFFIRVLLKVGLAVAYGIIKPFLQLIALFQYLKKIGFDTVNSLRAIAAGILHAFGLDKLIPPIQRFISWVAKIIHYGRELFKYLRAVTGGTRPFGAALAKLPRPIIFLAYVLGRLVKTIRVFFKTLVDEGFWAALKKMSNQMKALGLAVKLFIFSLTGNMALAKKFQDVFDHLADAFRHLTYLLDDLVHGRWAKAWKDFHKILNDLKPVAKAALDGLWYEIKRAFDAVPWETIKNDLWNGAKKAFDYLHDTGVPYVKDKAWSLIKKIWDKVNWNKVGDDVWAGIQTAFTFASDKLTWLQNKGDELISAVFNAVDWNAVGQTLLTGLTAAFDFVWKHPEALAVGAGVAVAVAFDPLAGIIVGAIALGIISHRKIIGSALSRALVGGFKSTMKSLGKAFMDLPNWGPQLVKTGLALAGKLIGAIFWGMIANKDMIVKGFLAIFAVGPYVIGQLVGKLITGLEKEIVKHPVEIAKAIGELFLLAAVLSFAFFVAAPIIVTAAFIYGLVKALWDASGPVYDWMKHLPRRMADAALGELQTLSDMGFTLLNAAYAGMLDVWRSHIRPWLHDRIDAIKSILETGYQILWNTGHYLMGGFWSGLQNVWDWIVSQLNYIAQVIANPLAAAYNAMWSVGHYIFTGLYDGMVWVWNYIIKPFLDEIGGAISAIIALKNKVSSPSKVMMDLGKNIAMGLALGLQAGTKDVDRASTGMMNAIGGGPDYGSSFPIASQRATGSTTNNRSTAYTFSAGSIVVNGTGDAEGTAREILRQIRFVNARSA